jgi:hypothetical protein
LGESSNRNPVRLKWEIDSRKLVGQWKLSDERPRLALASPYRLQFTPLDLDAPQGAASGSRVDVYHLEGDQPLFRTHMSALPQQLLAAGDILIAVSWRMAPESPGVEINGSPIASTQYRGDATIEVWETASGEKILQTTSRHWHPGDSREFACAVLSPDGCTLAASLGNTIVLLNIDDGQVKSKLQPGNSVRCLAFSRDGRLLASGQRDTTILLWDVADATRPAANLAQLTDGEVEACWKDLAAGVKTARRAREGLLADPAKAIALCQERLKPVAPVAAERIHALINDLNAGKFSARQTATRELAALGEQAADAIHAAIQSYLPPETRLRLRVLLSQPLPAHSPEALRQLRAISLLERIGTPGAIAKLQSLAAGDPRASETQAALRSLQQLGAEYSGTKQQ